ncbi:MAG TPA: nitrous oxide reductase accessory protein NosL [Vicinamibacterales bacterium]|nr:nitrous oxide reductase accessory protein NosL [Vicinamibacterales bacterium]
MKFAAVLFTMVWVGACAGRGAAPPAIVMDRSACSRCGMLISERAYAAAIRLPDGHDELFDEIGCLIAAVRERAANDAHYWFHDAGAGDWITDGRPVFVVSSDIRTPMGGGIVAYRSLMDAERAAGRQGGRVVQDVSQLLTMERSSR